MKVGGRAVAQKEVNTQVEHDLRTAEVYAFPLLFVLSLIFFRSLVAALLPLLVGGLAIVGTFLMLRVASELTSVSIFALNLVTGLGLGLAIDYSLFIVSRYREEIARHGPGPRAMRRTLATAGRTVAFSSLTVAGAIASLAVFPQRFLYSMGIGGFCVALIAAAIALIVLPAVLTLLGARVNSLTPPFLARRAERDAREAHEGFWYRLSRLVMRFPGRIAATTAALLIALGLPFFGIVFTSVDAQVLPESAERPPGRRRPACGVPALPRHAGDARRRAAAPPTRSRAARAAAAVPGAAAVSPPQRLAGGNWAIDVDLHGAAARPRAARISCATCARSPATRS